MITEDYVSFEIAKLLKEKGFDGECKRMFKALKSFEPKVYDCPEWITNEDLCDLYQNCEFATIPTFQMAMKWLREEKNCFIDIHNSNGDGYFYEFVDLRDRGHLFSNNCCRLLPTYEEACEAAIKYCLENLI